MTITMTRRLARYNQSPATSHLSFRTGSKRRAGPRSPGGVSREPVTCRFVRAFLCVSFKYLVGCGMTAAVAAILEGMPEPRDLRARAPGAGRDHGRVAGAVRVCRRRYRDADIALAVLRQLGFKAGWRGGDGANGELRRDAAQRGEAGGQRRVIRQYRRGGPGRGPGAWEQARAWRDQGCPMRRRPPPEGGAVHDSCVLGPASAGRASGISRRARACTPSPEPRFRDQGRSRGRDWARAGD